MHTQALSPVTKLAMLTYDGLTHDGLTMPLKIACGAAAMLMVAALIEAFWSPSPDIPNSVKYIGGALLWVAVFVYLSTAGRWERRT